MPTSLFWHPIRRPGVNWHHRNFLNRWWQYSYRRKGLLDAVGRMDRFIAVAATASEDRPPVFVYVSSHIRPSHAIQCFALDDDYSFGVLQSSLHESWFRDRCSTLEERLRYTSKTVFDSFPWPQAPQSDAVGDVVAVGFGTIGVSGAEDQGWDDAGNYLRLASKSGS